MKNLFMNLIKKIVYRYVWIYEREDGDYGIVIARTYDDAVTELRKTYPDTDDRLAVKGDYWLYGMNVMSTDKVECQDKVIITHPY